MADKKKKVWMNRRKDRNRVAFKKNRSRIGHNLIATSAFLLGCIFTAAILLVFNGAPFKSLPSPEIRSLHQLLTLTPEQLESVDIGLMNLLCAQGLKGAEDIDVDKYMVILDEWADLIKHETEIRLWQFEKHTDYYDNSESLFRMVMLVLGLKEKLGVHYNLENMNTPSYADSSQIFIHGLLGPEREGSCVSLPVLCIAVGRRLGYPVRLVHTAAHSFVRWDDRKTGERINIEPSMKGTDSQPDEYYKKWPLPLTDLQLKSGYYLRSLTAAEELSSFLIYRGKNLEDTGRITEAQIAFANAYCYCPNYSNNLVPLAVAVDKEMRRLWESDCETMGTWKVRYASYSGFTIDPREAEWTYPPLPPVVVPAQVIKEKDIILEELLYAELAKELSAEQKTKDMEIPETLLQSGYMHAPHQPQMNYGTASQNQQIPTNISQYHQQLLKKIYPNIITDVERSRR